MTAGCRHSCPSTWSTAVSCWHTCSSEISSAGWKATRLTTRRDSRQQRRVAAYVERGLEAGDPGVLNLIGVSFLENLANDSPFWSLLLPGTRLLAARKYLVNSHP
jgi:hypothetical protein